MIKGREDEAKIIISEIYTLAIRMSALSDKRLLHNGLKHVPYIQKPLSELYESCKLFITRYEAEFTSPDCDEDHGTH